MRGLGLLGLVLAVAVAALLARQQLSRNAGLPSSVAPSVVDAAPGARAEPAQAASAVRLTELPRQVQGDVDALMQDRVRVLQQATEPAAAEGGKP